jgi:hypothetical protein
MPDFFDRENEIAAHSMAGQPYSYEARVMNLLDATSFPVSTDGFNSGVFCEPQYGELCASGSCQNYACADKRDASVGTTVYGKYLAVVSILGALISWM